MHAPVVYLDSTKYGTVCTAAASTGAEATFEAHGPRPAHNGDAAAVELGVRLMPSSLLLAGLVVSESDWMAGAHTGPVPMNRGLGAGVGPDSAVAVLGLL
jgi:hypothetical protein